MKARIRQIQNQAKQKSSEKYFVLSRKLSNKWDDFLRKGHEKMTIMFIPHNEKKIFNFQISRFTLSFFSLLFIFIVTASLLAFVRNSQIKQKEEELLSSYKDIRSQLYRYQKLTSEIEDLMEDIKPEVEDIYRLAAGTDEIGDIWTTLPVEIIPDDKKNDKILNQIPDQINDLRTIRGDIQNATKTIQTVKNFVDVRSKVINDTPSIIPNEGHITSLFGWRRSPFGFGRDFHTGIDIAAATGTPVKATAPGEVVSAGWAGGYGQAVRVRHKYGFETVYGHNSRLNCVTGQKISKGQIIAYVGQTGSATGPHCHYEIRLGGVAINPYPYMSRMW